MTGYRYFMPTEINQPWQWDDSELNILLEKAAIKLGELNSYSRLVPNIDLFIQLHVTKEAVISSRIEGTQTQIDEAMLEEDDIVEERRNDWKEVNNYVNALNSAIQNLDQLPISSRLLRNTHRILLDSVRGQHKQPGTFRQSQNWIGGRNLKEAIFIPPHHEHVDRLMGDLENFIHNEDIQVPALVKIAIAHYQFKTIHPFLDGNGRIGRLLITLFFVEKGILKKPLLYLSKFFESNKGIYYDNLMKVRTDGDMVQWIKYFLRGITTTAGEATQTLGNVLDLKANLEERIRAKFGRRSHNAIVLLHQLFKKPLINVKQAQSSTGISYKAANDLIRDFQQHGILAQRSGQSRNRIFVFQEYLDLFQD